MNTCCPAGSRPRLFNWITVVLVAAWVTIVAVVAELAPRQVVVDRDPDVPAFVESLIR